MSELAKWDSFYGILGSAAATLIGLQFVVLTLIAGRPSLRMAEAGAAFGTPTIVHFSATLLVAAILRAMANDRGERGWLGPDRIRRADLFADRVAAAAARHRVQTDV